MDKTIVLDVGDTLVTDGMQEMFICIHNEYKIDFFRIFAAYRILKRALWSGSLSIDSFWKQLGSKLGIELDSTDCSQHLIKLSTLIIPSKTLDVINSSKNVILFTNHRSEWLYPILKNAGIKIDRDKIFCSDEKSFVKPDISSFVDLSNSLNTKDILFVDDNYSNLVSASEFGWSIQMAYYGWWNLVWGI